MQEGGHRPRPQGARRPGRERPARVHEDRRAGQGGARSLSTARRREVFLHQADTSAAGRSPLYEQLWRRLADEPLVDDVVDDSWDAPLRLAAGLHYLVLEGRASWDTVDEALVEHGDFLRRFVAEQGVQTNEVQRSWMLLPCFLELARRTGAEVFDLIELGPSAGLNLVWDRYRYRYLGGTWGRDDARVELVGEERAPVDGALLRLTPRVRARTGIDIAPIDVTTDEAARVLKSFVWADQTWRLELLDRAIEALREDPPRLVRGDLVDELPPLLARRRPGALTVVVHTAVLGYVEPSRRKRLSAVLEEAGASAPLAVLSTGRPRAHVHDYWGLWAQIWPGGERSLLAHADFHGAWIEWL